MQNGVNCKINKIAKNFENNFLLDFLLNLFKYVFTTAIFFILFKAKILNVLSPCCYGIFLSFIFVLNLNNFYLSLGYVLAGFLSGINLIQFVFLLFTCISGCFVVYLCKHKVKKLKIKKLIYYFLNILVAFTYIILKIFNNYDFVIILLETILNIVSMICCNVICNSIFNRCGNFNLNCDEAFCGGVVLLLIFCGLANVNIFCFDIVKFFGLFLILLSAKLFSNDYIIVISLCCGVGATIGVLDVNYVLLFACVSMVATSFKELSNIILVLAVFLVDLVLSMFFISNTLPIYYLIISSFVACLLFLLISKKRFIKLRSYVGLDKDNNIYKNFINQKNLNLSKQLMDTSNAFYEMNKIIKALACGNLDSNCARDLITTNAIALNCDSCSNKEKCLKNFNDEHRKVFSQLTNSCFEKGKVSILDLPSFLSLRCIKTNSIIKTYNDLLKEYQKYEINKSNQDSSKMLVAEQLDGISKVLFDLSISLSKDLKFNINLQELIKDELIYNNIIPLDVVCLIINENSLQICLYIRKNEFDENNLIKIISKVCKHSVFVDGVKNIDNNSLFVTFLTKPKYSLSIGIAQVFKGGETVCGDTHSELKLSNNKYLLGICDGMGHGEKAKKFSELTIGLIENYYKVGMSSLNVINMVNSLLNINQNESFSALDISIVDLLTGEVDFIKQGAYNGYILNKNDIFKIEGSSLPIGVLKQVNTSVKKTILSVNDFLIMVSDGVCDSFRNEQNFEEYLRSLNLNSPQLVANAIMKKVNFNQKNYLLDDATVIVAKLFYN